MTVCVHVVLTCADNLGQLRSTSLHRSTTLSAHCPCDPPTLLLPCMTTKPHNFSPVWGRGSPPSPYPFTSPFSTLSFTFSCFYFSLSYSLYLFYCFFIPPHSTRIVALRFHARCYRRRLNLTLVFLFCLYVFFIII